MLIHSLRSGGQSGVDRAVLDIAIKFNIPYCGWVPKDGWTEDIAENVTVKYPNLKETPSKDIKQRTDWNVRDSHATLIYSSKEKSLGVDYTIECCGKYCRPYFLLDQNDIKETIEFLSLIGNGLTVNIAGARESECPGIYEKSSAVIGRLLEEAKNARQF